MTRFCLTLLAALISSLSLTSPVYADDDRLSEKRTVVHMRENAQKKVDQDRLQATLRMEVIDADPAVIQTNINSSMAAALKVAETLEAVKVSTGAYNVHKHYNRESKKDDLWRGYQTITLDSDKPTVLLKLAGMLQDNGMVMSSLGYYLSQEKKASYRDELIANALLRVRSQAESIATQMGKKGVHIAEINIHENSGGHPPMMRAMAMEMADTSAMKAMPAPVASSQEETVQVDVNVTIWLMDVE